MKNDYDQSQEKFDRNMKVSNNQIQDLKEEITEHMDRILKLQIFKDDYEENKKTDREKLDKLMAEKEEELNVTLEKLKKERDSAKNELMEFKQDYNVKMSQIRVMEAELEEKLAAADADPDGA